MPTENGWEPHYAPADLLEWVRVPGAEHVSLQFMKGWPSTVLRAFAADYNAYVEPLRNGDSAAFTKTNSVRTSNHLNGTGMDLNWNGADGKTFRLGISESQAYPGPKAQAVRDLLDFYTFEGLQIVFCGGKWSIRDWMHFQMNGNTWKNPKVLRFIEQRIRPDGFSTYKRGGTGTPPPVEDGAEVLSRAMGGSVSLDRYRELLPGFRDAVTRSNAATPKRINMFVAQIGHESGGLKYMEEIADGSAYEGRADLGNNQPGDGKRFKGRGPIQITGRHNYTQLSKWAHSKGYVPSPTFFVDNPTQLATPQYGFLGAIWYWTVARPKINEYCDWDDLEESLVAVTKAINGGTNGLVDRRNRLNRARSMDLAPIMRGGTAPPVQGDDMANVPQEQWDRVYRELTKLFRSRSPLRHLGEGEIDTLGGFILNVDGSQHVEIVKTLAEYGHPPTLALLQEVASAKGDGRYPDRQEDADLAAAILFEATKGSKSRPTAVVSAAPSAPEVVYLQPAEPVVQSVELDSEPGTAGQIIGRAYDALADLHLSDALTDTERAPLTALIAVLETKTKGETP
jgi:putative chitinase